MSAIPPISTHNWSAKVRACSRVDATLVDVFQGVATCRKLVLGDTGALVAPQNQGFCYVVLGDQSLIGVAEARCIEWDHNWVSKRVVDTEIFD